MRHFQFLILTFCMFALLGCTNDQDKSESKSAQNASSLAENANYSDPSISDSISTVKIGSQVWMDEDIQVTTYQNGDPIPLANTEKKWEMFGKRKEGCYRKLANGTFIYSGYAMQDKRGILPAGFAVPTAKQFNQLIKFLGGGESQDGKATLSLAAYTIYVERWIDGVDSTDGGLEFVEVKTNGKSGFRAKEGGFVYDHGGIGNEGECSFWWTSTAGTLDIYAKNENPFVVIDIGYCSQDLGGGVEELPSSFGFAIRGIKIQ
jgi:uncharacterized protein (TIGR02145 family)